MSAIPPIRQPVSPWDEWLRQWMLTRDGLARMQALYRRCQLAAEEGSPCCREQDETIKRGGKL